MAQIIASLASGLLPGVISGAGKFITGLVSGKGFVESAKEGLLGGLSALSGGGGDTSGINQQAANSYQTARIIDNPNQINNRQFYSPPNIDMNEGLYSRNNSNIPESTYRRLERQERREEVGDVLRYGGRALHPSRAGAAGTNEMIDLMAADRVSARRLRPEKRYRKKKLRRRYKDYFGVEEEGHTSKGRNRRYQGSNY